MVTRSNVATLGERIRELRMRAGWTQLELADRAGTRLNTVYRIEADRMPNPGWRLVCSLADALGVSLDALAGR